MRGWVASMGAVQGNQIFRAATLQAKEHQQQRAGIRCVHIFAKLPLVNSSQEVLFEMVHPRSDCVETQCIFNKHYPLLSASSCQVETPAGSTASMNQCMQMLSDETQRLKMNALSLLGRRQGYDK